MTRSIFERLIRSVFLLVAVVVVVVFVVVCCCSSVVDYEYKKLKAQFVLCGKNLYVYTKLFPLSRIRRIKRNKLDVSEERIGKVIYMYFYVY